MSWWYRHVVRPVLFNSDSEEIHNRTMRGLGWFSRNRLGLELVEAFFGSRELPVKLFGLNFPNPIGLAAGMDKTAEAVPIWRALGFGFCELGGVTWHGQPGNPAPRMFRAIEDHALINRMGFNNPGAEVIASRLETWRQSGLWPKHPVGINLGKSKIAPLEKAAEDYAQTFRLLKSYADFFVVNVSSPNTPNLRQLQDKDALAEIFLALRDINVASTRPILVKVAPDLSFEALDEILELTEHCRIAGIVATNTTISRPIEASPSCAKVYLETGGLSGKPLRRRSTEVISHIYQRTGGKLPIIGVGGIFSPLDAWEKIIAGASLLQVYTGMVYEGPSIAGQLVTGIAQFMSQHGIKEVREATGLRHRQSI